MPNWPVEIPYTMRTNNIAPSVTLKPRPYSILFLPGFPLSIKRNAKLEAKLTKPKISKITMIVFNTGILKH